jgi:hypothetical protein
MYYETLEAFIEAIKTCFDQKDLQVLERIEICLLRAANKEYLTNDELFDSLGAIANVIDIEELKNELEEIPVHIKLYNQEATYSSPKEHY